jgi:hypothetical protein
MSDAWSKAVLGAVSLFPTFGRLQRLREFYPARRRPWFIVIATTASLVVYTLVQFFFDYVLWYRPGAATAIGVGLLIAYAAIHEWTRRRELHATAGAINIFVLLALYTCAITLLTYAYNTVYQLRHYDIWLGTAVAVDGGAPLKDVTIAFIDKKHHSVMASTDAKGEFVMPVKRDSVVGVSFTKGEKGSSDCYSRTFAAEDVVQRGGTFQLLPCR